MSNLRMRVESISRATTEGLVRVTLLPEPNVQIYPGSGEAIPGDVPSPQNTESGGIVGGQLVVDLDRDDHPNIDEVYEIQLKRLKE